jgi:hypothetical protein
LVRRLFGDARQGVHQRVVGQRGVLRHAARELQRLRQGLAGGDEVLRQADAFAFLRLVDAAGQHHVRHARGADQARDAHGAAAAHEDAARALGQRVEGGRVGHADVAGRRELQPAAHHRAVQGGDDGDRPVLHLLQRRVPHARVVHAGAGIALLQLGQVEAGAKVLAFTVEHDRAHRIGQALERVPDAKDERIAQRVALGRAREAQDRDGAAQFELEIG